MKYHSCRLKTKGDQEGREGRQEISCGGGGEGEGGGGGRERRRRIDVGGGKYGRGGISNNWKGKWREGRGDKDG